MNRDTLRRWNLKLTKTLYLHFCEESAWYTPNLWYQKNELKNVNNETIISHTICFRMLKWSFGVSKTYISNLNEKQRGC